MIKLRILFLPLLLLGLSSCLSDEEKSQIKDCEGLAMLYYRGLPRPSKLYKDHCKAKEKTLKYRPEICQNALGELMVHGQEAPLKKKYGERIMECFNKVDLERFSKDHTN